MQSTLEAIEDFLPNARMEKEEVYMTPEYVAEELRQQGYKVYKMQVVRIYHKHKIFYERGLWRRQI